MNKIQIVIGIIGIIVSLSGIIITAFIACYIPRRILTNQIFASLISEYRKPVVGMAKLAIFDFFKNDCCNDVSNIHDEYIKKYKEQIEKPLARNREQEKNMEHTELKAADYTNALHFQRRLLSQFYADVAKLRYKCWPRLSTGDMQYWFTSNETTLLSLFLHMIKPAEAVFIKVDIPEPPKQDSLKSDVQMNKLLYRLYKEVKNLQENGER